MEHIEELSESLYKMKGFSRKKGGARELLRKENKGLGQGQLFFRGREWEEFYHANCFFGRLKGSM